MLRRISACKARHRLITTCILRECFNNKFAIYPEKNQETPLETPRLSSPCVGIIHGYKEDLLLYLFTSCMKLVLRDLASDMEKSLGDNPSFGDLAAEHCICEKGIIVRMIHDEIRGLGAAEALIFRQIFPIQLRLHPRPPHLEQRCQGVAKIIRQRSADAAGKSLAGRLLQTYITKPAQGA